jgi:hypothetical protein
MRAFVRPPAGRHALEMGHWMDKRWRVDTPGCAVFVTLVLSWFPFGWLGHGMRLFSSSLSLFTFFFFFSTWTARKGLGYMVLHCMHGRVSALGLWSFLPSFRYRGTEHGQHDRQVVAFWGILGIGIGQQNDEALRAGLVWRLGQQLPIWTGRSTEMGG